VGYLLGIVAGLALALLGVLIVLFSGRLFRLSSDFQRALFGQRVMNLVNRGGGPATYRTVGVIGIVMGGIVALYSLLRWFIS